MVRGEDGVRRSGIGSFKLSSSTIILEDYEPWWMKILDPQSILVLRWNRFFLFSAMVALIIDPLFFYLPVLEVAKGYANTTCLKTDLNLRIVVTCFRTVSDLFFLLHILIKFRTAYVAPMSRVFGRREFVIDSKKIARRYLRTDFFIDLAASLPLPQVIIWSIIPAIRSSHTYHTNSALVLIVLLQYIPRLCQIFPLSSEIINGGITKTAWVGAAYNLLLYMITSHVLGASWYLLSIVRYTTCWNSECINEVVPLKCSLSYLDCESLQNNNRAIWQNGTVVFNNCNASNQGNIPFNFGMFTSALINAASSTFIKKFFYCLSWGLQVLSSSGQTLVTSAYIVENLFLMLIIILGLVLFAHLIGNMQTYLQLLSTRLEEWKLKQKDTELTEEWMRRRHLPQETQDRVRKFFQYKWLATRGVDEEAILCALPTDLRRDIQRHLYLDLVRRVPIIAEMDDKLLEAIYGRLVSSLSTQGTCIVREGDPVTEMLFIIGGRLESSTTNGGRTLSDPITLKPGDFCGEELLPWALLTISTGNLPSSTRTVRALTEVEAFALQAEDLKFVANHFRLLDNKKLLHNFRVYSHPWRTWAACHIQASWRRYKGRKLAMDLSMLESLSFSHPLGEQAIVETGQEGIESAASASSSKAKQNLGVTVLASRFAGNTRKGAQKLKDVKISMQNPCELDFCTEATEADDD